jgi:hypothetical protein
MFRTQILRRACEAKAAETPGGICAATGQGTRPICSQESLSTNCLKLTTVTYLSPFPFAPLRVPAGDFQQVCRALCAPAMACRAARPPGLAGIRYGIRGTGPSVPVMRSVVWASTKTRRGGGWLRMYGGGVPELVKVAVSA